MFGWRKEITNLECDIIALKGYLEGLDYRLTSLIRINDNPDYRGDLSDEIKRVEEEIEKTNIKLTELKNSIS